MIYYILFDEDSGDISIFDSEDKLNKYVEDYRKKIAEAGRIMNQNLTYINGVDYQLFETDRFNP